MSDDFQTTSWGLILATRDRDTARSREALAALCQAYWQPLYIFVRRRGYEVEEARDLTQAFFAHLLEKQVLQNLEPGAGRLRSFMLASLKNLMADERSRVLALKRGAGRAPIPLDVDTAESGPRIQPSHNLTPELVFEKRWATTVLQRVLDRLRDEFERADKTWQFEQLKPFLTGERPALPYRQVATNLEMTVDAARKAVHRLRKRYGKALRAEIGETVASPEEIDDEIKHLRSVLRS